MKIGYPGEATTTLWFRTTEGLLISFPGKSEGKTVLSIDNLGYSMQKVQNDFSWKKGKQRSENLCTQLGKPLPQSRRVGEHHCPMAAVQSWNTLVTSHNHTLTHFESGILHTLHFPSSLTPILKHMVKENIIILPNLIGRNLLNSSNNNFCNQEFSYCIVDGSLQSSAVTLKHTLNH